jgi:hypothetical protein
MSTRIWIRVISFTVQTEGCKPELGIVVYPTEAAAKAATKEHGGLVLPVDSDDLKNMFTPQEFSIEGVKELHRSAILTEHATSDAVFFENSFEVDYSSLEHFLVPEFVPVGDGEEMIHVMDFGDDAKTWFRELEAELGCFVHIE